MSDIIVRTFKCTGCGEARPCTLTTTQAKAEIAFFDPAEHLECVLDKTNKTAHNWKEVQANGADKSTEPALHKHIVSVSLPTDEHIAIVAGKKALKYAYANEYQYDKIVKAITEGAEFAREYCNER